MFLSEEFDKEWWSRKRYVIKGIDGAMYEGHCYGPCGFNDPITHSELVFLYDDRNYAEFIMNTDLVKIKDKIEIIEIGENELRSTYTKSNILQ